MNLFKYCLILPKVDILPEAHTRFVGIDVCIKLLLLAQLKNKLQTYQNFFLIIGAMFVLVKWKKK